MDDDGVSLIVGHRHYRPHEFIEKISKKEFEMHESAHALVNSLLGVDVFFGSLGTFVKEDRYYNFIAYNGESKIQDDYV